MNLTPTIEVDNSKSRGELAVDLLKAYKWPIIIALVLVLALLWWVQPSFPELPLGVEVAALAVLGAFALGYIPAWWVLNKIHNPPKRYVVSLGLSQVPEEYDLPADAWKPGIYELSPAAWDNVVSVDGEIHQWDGMKWPTYEVLAFDREELRAVGTWRGSKPDSELLRREKEIDELRRNLEQAADHSVDLEIAISSKVRQAVREIGQAIIEEHAAASTYNGERVAEVLSEIRQDIESEASEPQPNGDSPQTTKLKTINAIEGEKNE